jgi:hypothetical protein
MMKWMKNKLNFESRQHKLEVRGLIRMKLWIWESIWSKLDELISLGT